eukprot:gb/GFBE01036870.1/.p1 GENE.gb/GFBE01036870.1/~~gb/GFBE01036870.1/.p1  ORF type:complete len:573 (+),score=146.67 gb/GFBE01036870.1/:1-1719(+)
MARFQVMWLSFLLLPLATAVKATADEQKKGVDVNYVTEMLDKLKVFVQQQTVATQDHFTGEMQRLRSAMASAPDGANMKLLADTLKQTEMEKIEAEAASLEAMQYYHTVRAALGSQGGAPSCDFLSCGRHAFCRVKDNGRAFCECAPCFSGDGFTCKPSACTSDNLYSSELIRPPTLDSSKPDPLTAREITAALIGGDRIVVAVRDEQQGDRGFLIVGRIETMDITWGEWQPFSGDSKAFAPVIVGFDNGRLLVSYRDAEQHGIGYLVSGQLDKTALSGLKVALGMPHGFVKEQEQKLALVQLSNSRVVCLYADHTLNTQKGVAKQASGGAALVQVLGDGQLSMLGKYHFADGMPVSHIAATRLTEFSFVVAYRALPPGDADSVGMKSNELSAVWMEVSKDNLLVIDPHVLTLESSRPKMLERDVALVSHNLFSYSYYSAGEKLTKMALVKVEKSQGGRKMTRVSDPTIIAKGFNALVGAISLPAGVQTPSTFTYIQPANENSQAAVCGVTEEGEVSGCKDLLWADSELAAATGMRLPDGRLLFTFINKGGTASTRFLSAEEASAQDISTVV